VETKRGRGLLMDKDSLIVLAIMLVVIVVAVAVVWREARRC